MVAFKDYKFTNNIVFIDFSNKFEISNKFDLLMFEYRKSIKINIRTFII